MKTETSYMFLIFCIISLFFLLVFQPISLRGILFRGCFHSGGVSLRGCFTEGCFFSFVLAHFFRPIGGSQRDVHRSAGVDRRHARSLAEHRSFLLRPAPVRGRHQNVRECAQALQGRRLGPHHFPLPRSGAVFSRGPQRRPEDTAVGASLGPATPGPPVQSGRRDETHGPADVRGRAKHHGAHTGRGAGRGGGSAGGAEDVWDTQHGGRQGGGGFGAGSAGSEKVRRFDLD